MAEIIPSINAVSFEGVMEKIKKVEPYVQWCHIDVTDGIFSAHSTWRDPEDLSGLDTTLQIEVHLMTQNPDVAIKKWAIPPVRRLIVHAEVSKDIESMIGYCHEQKIELGLSVAPNAPVELLSPWFGKADLVQVLAVSPGPSGQGIAENSFEKLAFVRKHCPDCTIEIDGGMNPETAKNAKNFGANLFVAGSFIFKHPNMKEAIENLQAACG